MAPRLQTGEGCGIDSGLCPEVIRLSVEIDQMKAMMAEVRADTRAIRDQMSAYQGGIKLLIILASAASGTLGFVLSKIGVGGG